MSVSFMMFAMGVTLISCKLDGQPRQVGLRGG